MSNFLKNLARRSAGLPLAAECRPTPSPVSQHSFEASEGLNEITSEETLAGRVEAPPARQSQTANTPAAPEVQRSLPEPTRTSAREMTAVTPRSSSTQNTTTILQPAASVEGVVSSNEITPPFRGEAQTSALLAGDTVAQFVTRDSELTPRAESAREQTPPSALPLSSAINSLETTSRLPDEQEWTWPEVTVKAIGETAEDKLELIATDHLIRPAPIESTVSFQFPKAASAPPQPRPTMPIQVRIGRVEVRGAPRVHEPTQAIPRESPSLGFASYHRLRRYRY